MYDPKDEVSLATKPPGRGDCHGSQYRQAQYGNNDLRLPYTRPEEIHPEKYDAVERCVDGDEEDDELSRDRVQGQKLSSRFFGDGKLKRTVWTTHGEQVVNG